MHYKTLCKIGLALIFIVVNISARTGWDTTRNETVLANQDLLFLAL